MAEILVRLAHSLVLTPQTSLPVQDEARLAEFARATLVPLVFTAPQGAHPGGAADDRHRPPAIGRHPHRRASEPGRSRPGSRLWDDMGDTLFVPLTAGAFVLQVMHPDDRRRRRPPLRRSAPTRSAARSAPSTRCCCGCTAARPRSRRGGVCAGSTRRSRAPTSRAASYSAMDPEAYAWVHATAFVTAVQVHPLARGRPMTAREQEELYEEMLQLGEILRVPAHAMPQHDRATTGRCTARPCTSGSSGPRSAEELLAMTHTLNPPLPGPLRTLTWPGRRAAGHLLGLTIAAGLTPDVRGDPRASIHVGPACPAVAADGPRPTGPCPPARGDAVFPARRPRPAPRPRRRGVRRRATVSVGAG